MIRFQEINKDNWEECAALKLKQEQIGFIASNLYSIAQSQFLDGFSSLAIYKNQTMIGYTFFGIDSDDNNYWLYRHMIDEMYQGNGYGQIAVQMVIEEIRTRKDRTDVLVLGYNPENQQAKRLYSKAGFIEEGLAPWGEMIAKYSFV
ncbi:GNAT family N-acetyltransferase [Paenibacillus sp. Soil522]|uniref:GNAT family N-acetyltransferase n=1 Tax=Paenibacillus sp. Soil522 TaxID=1736388 RepID=UPI0006F5A34A|nr:GNAT family N-acetyltransferase [Paenibacillus sp. Soil522]KRE35287.1 spermidine acetyltransferase [Paenibacillus sp. Soil522]